MKEHMVNNQIVCDKEFFDRVNGGGMDGGEGDWTIDLVLLQ